MHEGRIGAVTFQPDCTNQRYEGLNLFGLFFQITGDLFYPEEAPLPPIGTFFLSLVLHTHTEARPRVDMVPDGNLCLPIACDLWSYPSSLFLSSLHFSISSFFIFISFSSSHPFSSPPVTPILLITMHVQDKVAIITGGSSGTVHVSFLRCLIVQCA